MKNVAVFTITALLLVVSGCISSIDPVETEVLIADFSVPMRKEITSADHRNNMITYWLQGTISEPVTVRVRYKNPTAGNAAGIFTEEIPKGTYAGNDLPSKRQSDYYGRNEELIIEVTAPKSTVGQLRIRFSVQ
ncbi:hypothetical protein F5984_11850 [Rudanella paleaurantiibacter]|uniref:DUF2141 domain-containing protein n=1 Tax=Rudanella paleaurantiibacter TaxID=2614655 RepID=A0A7J5U1F2_9BACT|nr:hypothetical protein [Rudanella paleaurantiibacter]KAB7731475.1 hypothetical protein F5984_11850 [Rudanella paleaurantiibacter]